MQTIPASKILYKKKLNGDTLVFSLEKIDNLLCEAQAAIPFDAPDLWEDWINREVNNGKLTAVSLKLNGVDIGSITYAVIEDKIRELLITSFHIKDKSRNYADLMDEFSVELAKKNQCKTIRFHTVRKGLIVNALKRGWYASEIVMRKII